MNQEEYVEQALISIFLQVQEHFGDAIKSYFLCGNCAKRVFRDAKKNPGVQTSVHDRIEATLIAAYQKYMNSLM